MIVVIDTNIIVSALLSEDGKAFKFFSQVLDGKYDVVISKEIINEYSEVLTREKFGFPRKYVQYILDWFDENAIMIDIKKSDIMMIDEKDRIFYDVAKAYNAKLVTGNIKHFPVDEIVTSLKEIVDLREIL